MFRIVRLVTIVSVFLLLAGCGSDDPDEVALSDPGDDPTEAADDADGDEADPADDPGDAEGDEADPATDEGISEAEAAQSGQWVTVYALRDVDGHLWVESEERRLDEATEAVATAAMRQLFTVAPTDPGLFSPPVGSGVEVLSVGLENGLLTVDVSDAVRDASVGAAAEGMFQMAFAHTGAQYDTVDAVELRVEGEAIDELWGHVDWSEPATPDPYALAPIDVERPRYGEVWPPGRVTVQGTSVTYESTVELVLLDPDGEVVEETFTTAEQPDIDQRGPFEHIFQAEADRPGEWVVRVREPDPSDGEGRPPYTADILVVIE